MSSKRDPARVIDVLLVEDNPGDVDLTREALRNAKVPTEIHVASNGEIALAFLRREPPHDDAPRPDLILLDLNLPKLDGRETLAAIKADPELRMIPVVVLTTSDSESDIVRAYELSASAYVTKPVDLDRFLEIIRAIEDFWLCAVHFPPKPPSSHSPDGSP